MDVFDGTTSDFDWEEMDDCYWLWELPRVINPESGYVVTANNRIIVDHAKHDAGATFMSTGRADRVTEIIEGHIKSGHKMTVQDMIAIQ